MARLKTLVGRAAGRARHLPIRDLVRTASLTARTHTPRRTLRPINFDLDSLDRWFGKNAPVLYYPGFGLHMVGTPFVLPPQRGSEQLLACDPRMAWESQRDQDLASLLIAQRAGEPSEHGMRQVEERLARFLGAPAPNAMEAALRCITWLELARFLSVGGRLPEDVRVRLARCLLSHGQWIERRLYEVPLGGNHLFSHATGLLYLGNLMPGTRETDRWAHRSRAILSREILRQFRSDGGTYEQSTGYHLFTLEMALGATLLLRGQGSDWAQPVSERLRRAALFAGALMRPDATVPVLGDDDSGRLHRWGPDTRAKEVCAVAALAFEDPGLAAASAGATTAAIWLCGTESARALQRLASQASAPAAEASFSATGLHVLRDRERCHMTLWSRIPAPPAMLSHAHSDHNSVDVWIKGRPFIRDPGSGVYLGDADMRNRLRSTEAHSTLTVDGAEVSPFSPSDAFFMPPVTTGQRVAWEVSDQRTMVAVRHDGFRRRSGAPCHTRRVTIDRERHELLIADEVGTTGSTSEERLVEAWWHWGEPPVGWRSVRSGEGIRWEFTVAGIAAELCVPDEVEVTWAEPFPWSPAYGVILPGVRTVVRYRNPLPFHMSLRVRYG